MHDTRDKIDDALDQKSAKPAEFMGHPKGLAYIVFTEAWERFSFYGMQALLVLYMASHLLQPGTAENVTAFAGLQSLLTSLFGPLSVQAMATQIFGIYIGLIYFMPVFGGWLGDRYLGQQKAVLLGAFAMAIGHFLMAFETAFLFALAALIIGSGLLKGNLAAQVGRLYDKSDQRRDSAFSLYNMAINVGAFVAPLICGTLGELYGWHYGFSTAGVGMLVSVVIYLKGRHHLPADSVNLDKGERPKLQPGDGKTILGIFCLFFVAALYWTAQTQVWNTYPLWIRDRIDRDLFDFTVPVTWFQSLDALAVLILVPLVLILWRRQRERGVEPTDLTKIAIGCTVFALSYVWLAVGEMLSGGAQLHMIWPTVFHFTIGIAFLYVGPVIMALVSRAAPEAVNAMLVSSYYLSLFAGGFISGWFGRFYEPLSDSTFWLLHGAIVGAGAVIVVIFRGGFIKLLKVDQKPT